MAKDQEHGATTLVHRTKGKGKRKFGKGFKGNSKGGKGKSGFQGNCHNCCVYGDRAADCGEPKRQQGVGYVSDYDQQSHSQSPLVFMLTTLEDTNVDSQNPWHTVGKTSARLLKRKAEIDADHNISNKCDILADIDSIANVESNIADSDNHEEFPIPLLNNNVAKKTRMPKRSLRATQSLKKSKIKFGCGGDSMSEHNFDRLISEFERCHDKCCQSTLTSGDQLRSKSPSLTHSQSIAETKPVGIVKEISRDEINLINDIESTSDVLSVNEELV